MIFTPATAHRLVGWVGLVKATLTGTINPDTSSIRTREHSSLTLQTYSSAGRDTTEAAN
jgi:hypothetical protein